jgi:CRISPR/Cas system Type II protein with McrA/HNH and RuvC-like nuclease domain
MDSDNAEDDRSRLTEEEVERAVEQLREAYADMRRFYSRRGAYNVSHLEDDKWRKVVPELLSHGIHLHHFVKTSFEYQLYELKIPFARVSVIANSKAIHRYLTRFADRHREQELLLHLQLDTITVQLKNGRPLEDIIRDRTLALSAVVRYAFARQQNLTDLVAELRADAEFDLKFEPQCRQFVRSIVDCAE